MCEKCGFSGCEHDWKRWNPAEFQRGYIDYLEDHNVVGIEGNPPYNAGILYAKGFYKKLRDSLKTSA